MNQTFQGEHLLWGNLGSSAVIMSFVSAILCSVAYYLAEKKPHEKQWEQLGRFGIYLHSIAVLSIVAILFHIIHSHYFEYHYAWQHSSRDLPVHFMISCFWEGQEGSFLLWIFWQMVLANILLFSARNWRNPVLFVVMLSQVALCTMLLGMETPFMKLGSSPFTLLRESGVLDNAPIFKDLKTGGIRSDYMTFIKDGNGLNPLLQNYWMVIHPPTLFFGFATTVIPFAYAIAALWRRQYSQWIKPVLPWALLSVMVLGTGIIMGGFWAYESLSFGGYWAWDPVENASLIPWLVLIAALHLGIIYKSTGNALQATFGFFIATFILVLYATFLTRSGILGNSSVHSFTDLGMSGQLLLFVFMFIWLPLLVSLDTKKYFYINLAVFLLFVAGIILSEKYNISKWPLVALGIGGIGSVVYTLLKKVPASRRDEEVYTREFWMFIGSLILGISAFQVVITTSIPVLNKVFGSNLAPPANPIEHYNKWQLPMAIIIALLTGVAHLLKFKHNKKEALRKMGILALIALVLSVLLMFGFNIESWFFMGLLFAACFTIVANASLLAPAFNGKIKVVGASVAHIGFGVLLMGVLVSSVNKQTISALDPNFRADEKDNVYLEKGKPVQMGEYLVTYVSDSQQWVNNYYKVNYKKLNAAGQVESEFNLYPNGQINPKMGLVANPDTKHYLSHDVFTFVSSVPNKKEESGERFINTKSHSLAMGDTIYLDEGYAILKNVVSNVTPGEELGKQPIILGAQMEIHTLDTLLKATPMLGFNKGESGSFDAYVPEVKTRFSFKDADENKLVIETAEKDESPDFIIMKAMVFPWINLVWGGTIIMVIGFALAIWRRLGERKKPA